MDILDRYKLLVEEHRQAGEWRLRILRGWAFAVAALGASFGWVHVTAPMLRSVVLLLISLVTLAAWLFDLRNRNTLSAVRTAGIAIGRDRDARIPDRQRFFHLLILEPTKAQTMGRVVTVFAWVTTVIALLCSIALAIWGDRFFARESRVGSVAPPVVE